MNESERFADSKPATDDVFETYTGEELALEEAKSYLAESMAKLAYFKKGLLTRSEEQTCATLERRLAEIDTEEGNSLRKLDRKTRLIDDFLEFHERKYDHLST